MNLARISLLTFALSLSTVAVAKDNHPPDDDTVRDKDEDKPDKDTTTAAKCISHTTQARFSSGYDHLVHIKNSCDVAAKCQVSTDVNPKPQSVRVAPQAKETVLTFRGSPARAFSAKVECEMMK